MNAYFYIADFFVYAPLRFIYGARLYKVKEYSFGRGRVGVYIWRAKRLWPSWAWGQTIGRHIFILDRDMPRYAYKRLLRHELEHVRQGLELGIRFPILYLWEYLTKGYKNNRFEIEARNAENEF